MGAINEDIKLTADVVGDKAVKTISYELCAHPEDFEGPEWAGLPYWIENLEGLQYAKSATMIDIAYTSASGKRISDLSPLSSLVQLEELILKQNGIADISELKDLINLRTLDVSANQEITDADAIEKMVKLESLNISFNKITSVDALSNLENLEYISMSNNQITQLPDLSKLTKVYFLDASHNQLTDISAISGMKSLEQLNLSGNKGITDYTPLANLTNLVKENTTLPDNSKKDDLFAAIEVNRLFELFNISRMTEDDLENVRIALEAYDALSQVQKTYFDENRIKAARSNMQKVQTGGEPDYYPEYDVEGVRRPIFSKIEISVVDRKGVPMAGIDFVKMVNSSGQILNTFTTDSVGKLVLKHTASDALYDEIIVKPADDEHVAYPASVSYSVSYGNKTESINGSIATGLEKLQIMLIPKDEYVDKTKLQELLTQAEQLDEYYKYTENTYNYFKKMLENAKQVLENENVTQIDVTAAEINLDSAIKALKKTDVLTVLKLKLVDENGNPFTRPFKLLIWEDGTEKDSWNEFTDENGIAYLDVSTITAKWETGRTWQVRDCFIEAYDMTPIKVTLGVKSGKKYFKTIDGNNVGIDFEKEVVVTYTPEDSEGKTAPDSTVLEGRLEKAMNLDTEGYTPASIEALNAAILSAEAALAMNNVLQEDYNAAAAQLEEAMSGMRKIANKLTLQRQLEKNYSDSFYTAETWTVYAEALENAYAVYSDDNATQEEVDQATESLIRAEKQLMFKADKTELKEKLKEVKAINKDDYQSGYEELQAAIAVAEKVVNNETATQAEVDAQVEALQKAKDALVKKPVEVDYACYPGVFKAKVVDQAGNPIENVVFKSVINGKAEAEKLVSDKNGIIMYYVYSQNRGKTTYIQLADERYTTKDAHFFEADGANQWIVSMTTINGKPYAEGTRLTYTVVPAGQEEPEPAVNPFTDVKENKYYYDPVLWAVENGITAGKTSTTFAPDASCTRSQIVTFLWRANGKPEPVTQKNPFTDVSESATYYKAVLWAVENGITTGKTSTTFAPNVSCTRDQVVTFLWRANGKPKATIDNPFSDVPENSFYREAVLWAMENKITLGRTSTSFDPKSACTRGQVVTFLYRAANK